MDYLSDILQPLKKVYPVKAVPLATFLGGLLGGGYIIAENYKALGEPQKARKTWGVTIAAALLITAAGAAVPEEYQRVASLIALMIAIITGYITRYLQGNKIDAHIHAGGSVFGWGRVIAIGVIALLINVIFLAGVYLFCDAFIVS